MSQFYVTGTGCDCSLNVTRISPKPPVSSEYSTVAGNSPQQKRSADRRLRVVHVHSGKKRSFSPTPPRIEQRISGRRSVAQWLGGIPQG